ncbi:MAG TPA: PAS domain-containing protein, partial [Pyrinomonadaceae bacterium]|nr:PAS domain-containing protein [Pyrinomonadaceae bacterium]
ERLNTVIENIAEGLVISDLDGKLLHWNKASLEMHGFTKQDEHLRPFETFAETMELSTLDGKVLSLDEWAISRVLKGEILHNFEVLIKRKDIEWERIFSYGGARVKDASGKEIAFLSITDITDKKRAEEELKKLNDRLEQRVIERTLEVHQSEERLRLVGDNGTDGYWDWDLKTDETYMSPSFKALFGYEDSELPNHASTWQMLLVPEDRERAKQAYLDHINENKPYNLQLRYRHKNGSIVWVNCRGVALKDENGEFVRMVGTHINITQQKVAEESLYKLNSQLEQRVLEKTKEVRQSELHFRQLSESLPLLVWTCRGEDGMCDYLSPQWVEYTGISEEYQFGFEWLNQIHPDDQEQTINFWKQQSRLGEPLDFEFRIRRYDGVYRWFQTRAMPLKDSNGKLIKWFGTNVDIDNRKLNEQTMQLLQNLSDKVAKAESLEAAFTEILEELRTSTGWEVGEIWVPEEDGKNLTLIKSVFNSDKLLEKFSKESFGIKFAPNEGLPGMVWSSKKSVLMQNLNSDKRFLRRDLAEKTGVKTGIGIPILIQNNVLSVLTFFSKKTKPEDERSVKLITSVVSQIGEFLQRKKAENELRQSQLRLQLGISVAKMAIVELDLVSNVCELSPEAIELFGSDPEITKITREEFRNKIHPEDREWVSRLVENAGNPNGNGLLEVQHRIIRKDGEIRWFNVREQFYFAKNSENQIVSHKAVLVFLDITDSKNMEETVRLSEERLRRLHEIVSDYDLNYEEKINEIIKFGNEIFEFESGVLGEI